MLFLLRKINLLSISSSKLFKINFNLSILLFNLIFNFSKGSIIFINYNVNYGDVILSLDGTLGVVNNFLQGINGYGYKVTSNNIHNSIIYCSLIDERNKRIIQNNSIGSVIKHASKAKNELVLLNIKNDYINKIFLLQISYKNFKYIKYYY